MTGCLVTLLTRIATLRRRPANRSAKTTVRHRLVRNDAGLRNAAQIPLDQRHLGAVHGHAGARAHRHANIGLGQRRRIVDAIAGHRHDAALALQARHQRQLVGGLDTAMHLVDAQS